MMLVFNPQAAFAKCSFSRITKDLDLPLKWFIGPTYRGPMNHHVGPINQLIETLFYNKRSHFQNYSNILFTTEHIFDYTFKPRQK